MRRKLIQIAGSTQLVSLPREWCKKNNLKKGQELDVVEDGDRILINASSEPSPEIAKLDITNFGDMSARCLHALYKKGADEVHVTFKEPSKIQLIQDAIGKDLVGFEILEQKEDTCVIRYVSGNIGEFDSLMRRTFLLLLTMANQTYEFLRDEKYEALKNTAFLEEANNRFTTICRRYLNKSGREITSKVGPLYYIIEELEKIADQYKYMCQHFYNLKDGKTKLKKNIVAIFGKTCDMIRDFYDAFYKFDPEKVRRLKNVRNQIVDDAHRMFQKNLSHADYWLIYHTLAISTKVFGMTGSLLMLKL